MKEKREKSWDGSRGKERRLYTRDVKAARRGATTPYPIRHARNRNGQFAGTLLTISI